MPSARSCSASAASSMPRPSRLCSSRDAGVSGSQRGGDIFQSAGEPQLRHEGPKGGDAVTGPAQLVNDPCIPHVGWRVPSRSSRGSPDGVTPTAAQPFATVVIKNYPGDEGSRLDRPDTFRVNISAGKEAFIRWTGHAPRESAATEVDPGATDTVITHPVYGSVGWLAVVNPGPRTEAATRELLRTAYQLARSRYERRAESTAP